MNLENELENLKMVILFCYKAIFFYFLPFIQFYVNSKYEPPTSYFFIQIIENKV